MTIDILHIGTNIILFWNIKNKYLEIQLSIPVTLFSCRSLFSAPWKVSVYSLGPQLGLSKIHSQFIKCHRRSNNFPCTKLGERYLGDRFDKVSLHTLTPTLKHTEAPVAKLMLHVIISYREYIKS